MHAPTHESDSGRGSPAMWYALFGGPVAWFVGLCIAYFVVSPSCEAHDELPLHAISIVTLIAALGALLAGALVWRRSEASWPDDRGGRIDRTRFIAAMGVAISALFALAISAQWAAAAIHEPCWWLPRLPDSPDAYVQPADGTRVVAAQLLEWEH